MQKIFEVDECGEAEKIKKLVRWILKITHIGILRELLPTNV